MKRKFLLPLFMLLASYGLQAQVTQINSNKSLQFEFPISNTKAIYISKIDSLLWVTDGTLAGTFQLSTEIKFMDYLGIITFLDGKLIFEGKTAATGSEVYITDGTPAGTVLVKDIYPGVIGSNANYLAMLNGLIYFSATSPLEGEELWVTDGTPGNTVLVRDINQGLAGAAIGEDVAIMNGFIYFSAERPAEGRELWRSNGTLGGTTLVKDIVPGAGGSNYPNNYQFFSTGNYLLFMARTPASGVELWKSDGTDGGTVLLKDINTANAGADSSNCRYFYKLNDIVLFMATDATHGEELWKTDGTETGTVLVKDINAGPGASTTLEFIPGFGFPVFTGFHLFNNHLLFNANDGTSTGEVWSTDGITANTILLKDIVPGMSLSIIALSSGINLPNKLIFPVSDMSNRSELWESDGTPGGTKLFKAFSVTPSSNMPMIFSSFESVLGLGTQVLFQGNKFFFSGATATEGNELWISDGTDGTVAHTQMVKDINPGSGDGIDPTNISYLLTSTALFFPANNGTNGLELWKSDGTTGGTGIVADIVTGTGGSDPDVAFFLVNNKVLFTANNGDDPILTDLYAVDGTFTPLPVSLADFTVMPKVADALLSWHTSQELNSKNFTVQRSINGVDFKNIGMVSAAGTSAARRAYSFTDAGIMNSGNNTLYYRLLVTDIDGKSAVSPVITLKLKNAGNWNVRLMANPVAENIKVLLSGITQNVQVTIIDLSGKKLYTSSFAPTNGQISIPAVNLPRGRYVLLTETGNERKSIQFVK